MSSTRIEVKDLVVRYGDAIAVNGVSFTVGRGEHVTLLGPSGCGKTTTLRAIAGLEQPTAGSITVDGQAMFDSAARRNVPAEQRGVSMVFQSYAVWPHMTVFDNVAYGLRVRKQGATELKTNVERALDLVQMRHLAERGASKLSGGQQQRVALARAIAFSPTVVLFDEPLSNLDAKLRAEMRVELRELQRRLDITSVYVTHDQEEALAISDRVIVMNVGVIEQIGAPEEIYNRPKSRFVADFVGSANLIKGKVVGAGTFEAEGGAILKTVGGTSGAEVAVRTAYIDIAARAGENQLPGTVRQRMFHGDFVQYIVECSCGRLIVRRPPTNLLEEGAAVTLSFSPEHTVLLLA
jgi:iron(III) transport system ATP-binding protein